MGDNPILHRVPDHPILNLEVAQRALARHRDCGDDCAARRYFLALVPALSQGQRPVDGRDSVGDSDGSRWAR
ncbi:hypothetical protein IU501_19875 [Nocardia otitidiscaviarum]|uniref:hypothetical protein n=1 Tax=Nocardia otitidiscaviarum TaxID=1823 RepID=UPI0018960C80|nr:hypothetical protein [Nocardia otitidiscaviarum]MBF6135247.1 hypothetical protein [Nocardia otitidiscaviarum]